MDRETPRHGDPFGAFVPGPRCAREPSGEGLLSGLGFAVKDLVDVAGCRTGGGNPHWLAGRKPAAASAPVVDALLAAGARLVGKTITDELAFSLEGCNAHYGTPVNPACPDRLPGGSSSGSAVAVAAGLADFALGTDTGGSVRVPASFTGTFGFRPTHGRLSTDGVLPFAPSYDTVGWLARDAGVLSRAGEALLPAGPEVPVDRLVLGRDAFALAAPAVAAVLRSHCAGLGIGEERAVFDGAEAEWLECYRVLQGAEIWRQLGPWISAARPAFGAAIAARFADAAAIAPSAVARFLPVREAIAARLRAMVPPGTGLVIPTAPGAALPKAAAAGEIAAFYRAALTLGSIAGHAGAPQVTLPVAQIDGCPIGLSIVGAVGADRGLLAFARKVA